MYSRLLDQPAQNCCVVPLLLHREGFSLFSRRPTLLFSGKLPFYNLDLNFQARFEMFSLQAVVSALKSTGSIAEPVLDNVRATFSAPSSAITLGNVARALKHTGLQDSVVAAVLRYLLGPFTMMVSGCRGAPFFKNRMPPLRVCSFDSHHLKQRFFYL